MCHLEGAEELIALGDEFEVELARERRGRTMEGVRETMVVFLM